MLGPDTAKPYSLLWVPTQSYYTILLSCLLQGVHDVHSLQVLQLLLWMVFVVHMLHALVVLGLGLLSGLSWNENVPLKHPIPLKMSPNVLWIFCIMVLLLFLSASISIIKIIFWWIEILNWLVLVILTFGVLFGNYTCIPVCTALHNSMHFLSSVLHFVISACIESMFKLIMLSTAVSGILSSAWPFPGTTKNTHHFFKFLNLIETAHVPYCVICILLYVLSFMLPFMDPLSCSSDIFLNSFLNIHNGTVLPLLPVMILYGISMEFLPSCVSK